MKLTKLKLARFTALTILPLLAAAALQAPLAAKADSTKTTAHKGPKHREMALEMTGDGPCLKCKGNPGEMYCIEATTDLAHPNWQPICTPTITADGYIEYTDTCASNYPCRFYRVSWSSVKQNNGNHYGSQKNGDNQGNNKDGN